MNAYLLKRVDTKKVNAVKAIPYKKKVKKMMKKLELDVIINLDIIFLYINIERIIASTVYCTK